MKKKPKGPSWFSFISEFIPIRLVYFLELMRDYGGIVKIPSLFRVYLISDAKFIKYALKQQPDHFIKEGLGTKPLRETLGNGLILNQGAEWKARRSHLAGYFQPKSIAKMAPAMQKLTQFQLSRMQQYAASNESFDIAYELTSIVYGIAEKVLFNHDTDRVKLPKILHSINIENRYSSSLYAFLPWSPTYNNYIYHREKKYINNHVKSLIKSLNARTDDRGIFDILSNATMADKRTPLNEQAIFDEVKTFIMSGHETTGATLAWLIYSIAQTPEIQDNIVLEANQHLQGKLPDYEDTLKLKYTRMVLEETLRLYPPIWAIIRKSFQSEDIHDVHIKANSELLICPFTLHRNETYWEKPNEFKPERHCPEAKQKQKEFSYLPFGGGPRICIASHMAIMECIIILVMLLQEYRIELDDNHDVIMEHLISLKPKNGIKVRISKR